MTMTLDQIKRVGILREDALDLLVASEEDDGYGCEVENAEYALSKVTDDEVLDIGNENELAEHVYSYVMGKEA